MLKQPQLLTQLFKLCNHLGQLLLIVNQLILCHSTPSCFNLFIVSKPNKILLFDQVGITIGDHDLILLSYNIPIVHKPASKRTYINFKNFVAENLHADIDNLSWNNLYLLTDTEQQDKFFNSFVIELFEKHVLLQENNFLPKMPNCSKLIHLTLDRDMAHNIWRRSSYPTEWEY